MGSKWQVVIPKEARDMFNILPGASLLLLLADSQKGIAIERYSVFAKIAARLFTDKQVGGFCDAFLTNATAWLSSAWFSLELVGGVFAKIANLLPFSHAVNYGRYALICE